MKRESFKWMKSPVSSMCRRTFSNIEQQSLEFVKYTLNPWVCRWEQALTRSLLSPKEKREYSIKFNVDGLLRGDYQSRMNGYAVGRQNGWMSANDISGSLKIWIKFLKSRAATFIWSTAT